LAKKLKNSRPPSYIHIYFKNKSCEKKVNKIFKCPSPEKFGTQIQSVPYCDQKKKKKKKKERERKDLLGVLDIGIEKLEICNN